MGSLITFFEDNQDEVANYFALHLISRNPQEAYSGHTGPLETDFIVKRTLEADDTVVLINNGPGPLQFWMSANKEDLTVPATAITIESLGSKEVTPPELGASDANLFLMVHNPDANLMGDWEVEL